jgi:catalase
MYLFTDQTTPVSYRFADIFSVNLYKFTKAVSPCQFFKPTPVALTTLQDGSFKYVKIHMKTNEGVHNLTAAEATTISGQDPDYTTRDLFLAIEEHNFPSWTVYVQVIDPHKAEKLEINIFDATHLIPEDEFPLVPFGKITLNRNPENFFEEVEQAAFCPSNVVPGWDITPDPILQARLFAYTDAQRYRLGVNFNQLPTNRPFYSYNPTKRDGRTNISNLGSLPNYIPSRFAPKIARVKQTEELAAHEEWIGRVMSFESEVTNEDFVQPREFWRALAVKEQKTFVGNVAGILSTAVEQVREKTYGMLLLQIATVIFDIEAIWMRMMTDVW